MSDLFKAATASRRCRNYSKPDVAVWDVLIISGRDSVDFTYDDMLRLSVEAGSTDIDVRYAADDPGYSEYTPGTSSEFEMVVWLRKVEP